MGMFSGFVPKIPGVNGGWGDAGKHWLGITTGDTQMRFLYERIMRNDRLKGAAAAAAYYFGGPQAGNMVWNAPNDYDDSFTYVGDKAYGKDEEELSPEEQGRRLGVTQRSFMDAAYPGTNPWERLGTGQGGSAGSVAIKAQRTQERINRRTLSNNLQIADKQALAQVAPAVLAHHPELAGAVLAGVDPRFGSVGKNLNTNITERKFQFDKQIRTVEADIKAADVEVKGFNAMTQRFMAELESDKFDFNSAVRQAEVHLKNRELAIRYVDTIRSIYDTLSGTAWKQFRSAIDDAAGKFGMDTFLDELRKAGKHVDTRSTPVPGNARSSAPGRYQKTPGARPGGFPR